MHIMRPSQTRHVAASILFVFVILSLLSWRNRNQIPEYLEEAHDYFHPDENQKPPEPASQSSTPLPPSDHETTNYEFLQRPLLSYEQAVEASSRSCPTKGVNFDAGSVSNNEQAWREIPTSRIESWRHDIAAYLDSKHAEQGKEIRSKKTGGVRGIVMAAGDRAAVVRAQTNIRFLRSYNCTLPVEIFHFPNELSGNEKSKLSDLSSTDESGHATKVTLRVVESISKGNGWKAFQIKGAAMQQSSFDEILYLDTDSYLLRNPEFLFEGKHWEETGLLLWPDYTKSHATNPLWRLVGQPCRNEYEGESGQILISRSRHQEMLWVVEYFALHHEDFYGFMGGDRDSFRAAALLLGKSWAGPGRLNAAAGVTLADKPREGGHTMLQADPDGRWLFVHANLIKHGRFPRPLWQRIHRAANDRYEQNTTYGSISVANQKLGDGVELFVQQAPKLETSFRVFE
ncbi:Alpha-1,2-mannosyltransferase MNN23, partial [Lachnellula suecica]